MRILLKNPENFNNDLLNGLLREGAKNLIQTAVEIELKEYLSQYENCRTAEGFSAVVRNGYLPGREIQTGIGPIDIKYQKSLQND